MTDPLVELFDPLLQTWAHRIGLENACVGVARLLNAAALDAVCGHSANGDRMLDAVAGHDTPAPLRRMLAAMVAARRALWPDDQRVLRDWDIQQSRGGVMLKTECEALDLQGASELAVRLLVEVPPASTKELRARLGGLPRPEIRAALRLALEHDHLPDEIVDVVATAYDAIDGPGRQLRPLARIAGDDTLPPQRREAAWRVIIGCPPAEVEAVIHLVDLPRQQELTALGVGAMLRRIVGSDNAAAELCGQLLQLEPMARRELLAGLESVRLTEGIPAAAIYGCWVADRSLPSVDDLVVPALVADGGPAAEHALRTALSAEEDPSSAQILRRGLFDLRTARIDPDAAGSAGARAWVGVCDGQGLFPVLLATQNERLRYRLSSVVIRACGEIRDGFVADDLDVARLDALIKRYNSVVSLVETPAHLAAAWVAEGLAAVAGGLEGLPSEMRCSADEILRHGRHDEPEPEVVASRCDVRLADCRALYLRPTLEAWFLDAADLAACDIPLPPLDAADAVGWSRAHAAGVTHPQVRDRLAAMVEHLARLLTLEGDLEQAAVAARIGVDVRAGAGETFLRAVLEQTAFTAAAPDQDQAIVLRFGDEALREDVRRHLAPQVPRLRDLAALDLVDLLLSCERQLFVVHVDAARIRPDRRRAALQMAGAALAAGIVKGETSDLPTEIGDALRVGEVPEIAVEAVAQQILRLTTRFLSEVCQECPVQCWNTPQEPAGRPWSGPGHPAFMGKAGVPSGVGIA